LLWDLAEIVDRNRRWSRAEAGRSRRRQDVLSRRVVAAATGVSAPTKIAPARRTCGHERPRIATWTKDAPARSARRRRASRPGRGQDQVRALAQDALDDLAPNAGGRERSSRRPRRARVARGRRSRPRRARADRVRLERRVPRRVRDSPRRRRDQYLRGSRSPRRPPHTRRLAAWLRLPTTFPGTDDRCRLGRSSAFRRPVRAIAARRRQRRASLTPHRLAARESPDRSIRQGAAE